MKHLFNRLAILEKNHPAKPIIDTSFIDTLEEHGCPIRERINGNLDYSCQDAFDRSVVKLLTTEELQQLAAQYPLEQ